MIASATRSCTSAARRALCSTTTGWCCDVRIELRHACSPVCGPTGATSEPRNARANGAIGPPRPAGAAARQTVADANGAGPRCQRDQHALPDRAQNLAATPVVPSPAARPRRLVEAGDPAADRLVQGSRRARRGNCRARARSAAPHIVTASAGNHGLGIAFAADRLGATATVVVPDERVGGEGSRRSSGSQSSWCATDRATTRPRRHAIALCRHGRGVRVALQRPRRDRGPGDDRDRARRPGAGPRDDRHADRRRRARVGTRLRGRRDHGKLRVVAWKPSSRRRAYHALAAGHPVPVDVRADPGRRARGQPRGGNGDVRARASVHRRRCDRSPKTRSRTRCGSSRASTGSSSRARPRSGSPRCSPDASRSTTGTDRGDRSPAATSRPRSSTPILAG